MEALSSQRVPTAPLDTHKHGKTTHLPLRKPPLSTASNHLVLISHQKALRSSAPRLVVAAKKKKPTCLLLKISYRIMPGCALSFLASLGAPHLAPPQGAKGLPLGFVCAPTYVLPAVASWRRMPMLPQSKQSPRKAIEIVRA